MLTLFPAPTRFRLPGLLVLAPAVWLSTAEAQMVRPGVDSAAAAARDRAYDAQEQIKEDIGLLTALRDAQQALIQWNSVRRRMEAPPLTLDKTLCEQLPAWCAALPATFGHKPEGEP